MKRFLAVLLTAAMALGLIWLAPAQAKAVPAVSNKEWVDDFSSDTIANYKNAGPDTGAWGNWQVADGKLKVVGNSGANWWGTTLLLGDVSFDDFIMEFDANVGAGYGVILRAQDDATTAGSGLNAWNSGNAYVIWHNRPVESDGAVTVYDYNGSQTVVSAARAMSPTNYVHWKIVASGSDIAVSITDKNNSESALNFSFTDSRYSAGMVGLYNLTKDGVTTLTVDDLRVTPINSTLYENDFSDADLSDFIVAGPDNGIWGNWQAVDGKLNVTGNSGASWWGASLVTAEDYSDFIMEFDADKVSSGYGVFVRAEDDAAVAGSGLNAWRGGDGYMLMHWVPVESNASTQVLDFNGADPAPVLAGFGDFGAMSAAHWKVAAWGDLIYYKVTDMNDPTHSFSYVLRDSKYASGHVGFYNLVNNGFNSMKIDNLTIKGYKTPEQQAQDARVSIDWEDDFNHGKGAEYTAYGWWWNDFNTGSIHLGADYTGVLGNEGGDASGITYYYLNDRIFTDLTMEFDIVNVAAGAQYGVVVRAGDPGDGPDQGNGYTVMYDGNWMFAGKINGSFTQITDTPSTHVYNPSNNGVTPTHWKVVVKGNLISVYLNGSTTPALQVRDSTYKAGQVGFRALAPANTANSFVVDNLVITGEGPVVEKAVPTAKAQAFKYTGSEYAIGDLVNGFDGRYMTCTAGTVKDPGTYTLTFNSKGNGLFPGGATSATVDVEIALDAQANENAQLSMNAVVTDTVTAVFTAELADGVADQYEEIVFAAKLGSNDVREIAPTAGAGGALVFSFEEIYSQHMTEKINGQVLGRKAGAADTVLCSIPDGISIAEYCGLVAAAQPGEAALLDFMANMLNFGAECQKYANYNVSALATDGQAWATALIDDAAPVSPVDDAALSVHNAGYSADTCIRSARLIIKNRITLDFGVKAADATDLTLAVTGDGITPVNVDLSTLTADGEGMRHVVVENLSPNQYNTVFTAVLSNGATAMHTVQYSVNTYCARSAGNAALEGIVTAIYNYGAAAAALNP